MTRWYKRPGAQVIRDGVALSLEEKGAFGLLLDLMGAQEGPIPDNARWLAGLCGVSLRKWTALRDSLLARGLVLNLGDHLGPSPAYGQFWASSESPQKAPRNRRETASKPRDNSAETGAKPRDNFAENRPPSNENNGLQPRPRKKENKKEKVPPHMPPKGGLVGGAVEPKQVDLEEAIADAIPPSLDRHGEAGFDDFWRAFDPPPDASRAKALDAWKATTGKPPMAEMLACVAAYRKFIADETAKRQAEKRAAKPMLHPARWIEERRWEGFAAQLQSSAEAAMNDDLRKDRLQRTWNGKGAHLASLIGEGEFAAYFEDADLDSDVIYASSPFKRDHITQKFWKPLVTVFGASVSVQCKETLQ